MHDPLTFADIARTGVEVPHAVALVLAVAEQCDPDRGCAIPSSEHIFLTVDGRVRLETNNDQSDEREQVKRLAALLESLIATAGTSERARTQLPGALLLLVARATGSIDLPVPSLSAFREMLLRFGSADELTLAAVYGQCVAARPERRVRAARADDLRRELRQLELALFEKASPPAIGPRRARAAVAAALATAAVAASFLIGVKVVAPTFESRNVPAARPAVPAESRPPAEPVRRPTPSQSAGHEASAEPSVPQPPSPTAASATPVLTASTIGSDLFSPSFVEQGHAILFHAGRAGSSLMRLSLDDAAKPSVATILQDGAANFHPVRSPDGQRLAYDSDRDGTRAVYVKRVGSDNATKVSGEGYAAVPRWSPDGRKLAFIKAEPGRPHVWNVWIADLDAHSLTRVSHHAVGQAWGASWFPNGSGLAYSVEDRLVIADLARGTRRVVPSPIKGRLVRTPAVSPDGSAIVFQVLHDGTWLLQTATGRMRRVLSDPTAEEFAWSPDGRRVIYHTHRGGGWSLWQLALDRKTFVS